MEILKTKLYENKKFIFTLLICTFLTSLTMIFIYKNHSKDKIPPSSFDYFSIIIKDINTINSSLNNCSTNFTLNNKSIVDVLSANINSLEKTKTTLQSILLLDDKSRKIYNKLMYSIESTQFFYNYCISSLDLTTNLSLSNSSSKIEELEFSLLNSYKELNTYGFSLTLSDEALLFFDKLTNHLLSLDNLSKKTQIDLSKSADFIKEFKTSIDNLSNILEDFTPAITKIREDNRSLTPVIDDIYSEETALSDIKNRINRISIPEGYLSYYNSLIDHITLHSAYLNKLKIAVIYEKSSINYSTSKEAIDKNYKKATEKFTDVKESLNSLTTLLENY